MLRDVPVRRDRQHLGFGARIIRRCRATNITQAANGAWVVETEQDTITCDHVVNAGGTQARQLDKWSGLQLPMTSMTHRYFVAEEVSKFHDLERELPVIRNDRVVSGYIRMEQKKGLIGIYEKSNPNTVLEDHCSWEAENELFAADYDRFMPWLEESLYRMPIFADLDISRDVHHAISHPPEGNPLIGPAPGLRNYWCNCGTQIGIVWGPGLTSELVHGAAEVKTVRERVGVMDVDALGTLSGKPFAAAAGLKTMDDLIRYNAIWA